MSPRGHRRAGEHADDLVLVTNHVVGGTWTYLRRRASHAVASSFLDVIARTPRVTTHHVREAREVESSAGFVGLRA